MKYEPKHVRDDEPRDTEQTKDAPSGANIAGVPLDDQTGKVHPWGIPVPDPGDGAEYIPIAGDNRVSITAPNGAVVRNPWSEQPEIKPDYEYTDEKEDLNLLIM